MSVGSDNLIDSLFSNKEKSFLGCRGQKGMMENFDDVAEGADPNTSNWVVVEADGVVTVEMSAEVLGYCRLYTNDVATNNTTIQTVGKKVWNIDKTNGDIASLRWESKFNIVDAQAEFAVGFGKATTAVADGYDSGTNWSAGIHCDNDVVRFCTDDGSLLQATTITSFFTENTEIKYLVVLTTTDVKLYMNDVLKATHATRVPSGVMAFLGAAKRTNGVRGDIRLQYVHVWTE